MYMEKIIYSIEIIYEFNASFFAQFLYSLTAQGKSTTDLLLLWPIDRRLLLPCRDPLQYKGKYRLHNIISLLWSLCEALQLRHGIQGYVIPANYIWFPLKSFRPRTHRSSSIGKEDWQTCIANTWLHDIYYDDGDNKDQASTPSVLDLFFPCQPAVTYITLTVVVISSRPRMFN